MKTITTIGMLAAALAASPLAAQSSMAGMDHSQMQGMDHSKMMNDPGNPYAASEMDMHQKMMAAKQGDASEMWTRKMIEHHRGAVEMSQIVMRNGATPAVRREAMKTIASQNREIANLNAMLTRMGKPAQ